MAQKGTKNKIVQAEVRTIMRSLIHFASYNPRTITEEARKQLKANLKRVGLLGGIVWNERTGNLVSGHQKVGIIDEVNRYNPETHENDYEIRVEVVDMDDKTEKEQNLFMNNKKVQGDFDDDKLREMVMGGEIDYVLAGYDDFDAQLLGFNQNDANDILAGIGDFDEPTSETPSWNKESTISDNQHLANVDANTHDSEENTKLDRSVDFQNASAENQIARHNEVQKIKDRIQNGQKNIENDNGMLSYVILSFPSPSEKEGFMVRCGYDPRDKFIDGLAFGDRIDIID